MKQTSDDELLLAARRFAATLAEGRKEGLAGSALACLMLLAARPDITPTEIAAEIGLSTAAITGLRDRLRAAEMIGPTELRPADRRVHEHRVTRKGQRLAERLAKINSSPVTNDKNENHDQILNA